MKKYYRGCIGTPIDKYLPRVTEKAIAFTVAGGYTTANDKITYFPKSQIIIGEPNEFGNAEILIPYWLIRQKSYGNPTEYFRRLREVDSPFDGDEIVER